MRPQITSACESGRYSVTTAATVFLRSPAANAAQVPAADRRKDRRCMGFRSDRITTGACYDRLHMPETQPSVPPEMTVKAVLLGLFLALVFGSANAYLGMKAGQTIAATIPAAVIAIAVFRIPTLKGGILEQNIARTAASVGEALVAGAIFTIPAFMMVEMDGHRLWADLRSHYWQSTLILLVGGLIGVFFIIVLRRPLCVESDLPFPESVGSAEVVKAGAQGSDAPKYVFGAMGFAALIEILKSDKGFQIFREYAEGFLAFPRSVVHHFNFQKQPIGDVTHGGGIYWSTPSLSPALMGIGYIIGPELASINASGGVIAWWVLIPLLLFFDPSLPARLGMARDVAWDVVSYSVWYNIVRPIAVPCWWAPATPFTPCVPPSCNLWRARLAPPPAPRTKAATWSAPTGTSLSAGC